MKPSRYLEKFQQAKSEASDSFELLGNLLIVEQIDDEEMKTASGILLTSGTSRQINGLEANKPTFTRVLMVGQGVRDEESGELTPWDVDPGDILLVPTSSISRFSVFGPLVNYGETSLGLITIDSIQMRFKGQEGFDRFFSSLTRVPQEQVGGT